MNYSIGERITEHAFGDLAALQACAADLNEHLFGSFIEKFKDETYIKIRLNISVLERVLD